jgi:hypothetical protein
MKLKIFNSFILILSIFIIGIGCGGSSKETTPPTSSADTTVEYLTNTGSFNYTKNLGTLPVDVYFIFTNTNLSGTTTLPTVTPSIDNSIDDLVSELDSNGREEIAEPENNFSIIDKPYISEFNRLLPSEVAPDNIQSKSLDPAPPSFDTVGQSVNFYDDTTSGTQVAATCRKVVSAVSTSNGSKTLNIYVANNCWYSGGSGRTFYVTQAMVDTLADKFLLTGTNNDVYDWVANIYGAEWGTSSNVNHITPNDQITILLYDIDNDDMVGQSGAFVLGYFWSRDNFITAAQTTSNQRIMFCIDAVLFANNNNTGGSASDGSAWAITDYWPQKLIGTLAHEFQHMIHYYQKNVIRSTSPDTWINEMCSLVTEDLVADKLQISGPRNVTYNDPSAGSAGNTGGRLPLYNAWNDASVNTWYGGSDVLISYSINYALGAYLARNFGGAPFFKNVVQCDHASQDAIEHALALVAGNTDTTFTTILKKWAVANLLSNKTNADAHTRYNIGAAWSTDTLGYNLGSINLYNYYYSTYTLTGPWIYNNSTDLMSDTKSNLDQSSNTYFRAAKNVTGSHTWNLTTTSNVATTVVIKAAE